MRQDPFARLLGYDSCFNPKKPQYWLRRHQDGHDVVAEIEAERETIAQHIAAGRLSVYASARRTSDGWYASELEALGPCEARVEKWVEVFRNQSPEEARADRRRWCGAA